MNKKVIGVFKDKLGGNIMTEFVAHRAKAYAYSMEDGSEYKKAKRTKICVIKRQLMFENSKDDEKRLQTLQTFDKITSYPYGANVLRVCESKMMLVRDYFVEKYSDCPFL